MAIIKVLEKSVADKIAAGEVVDRPVSIVKELVENAIDSGATSITAEIRNGGKSYIRITDNGCGIEADEVELAFQRHATSKIAKATDLDSITTLGFRGEALASIGAVARVEVITKCSDARMGRRVIVDGSRITENSPIGCPEGTTITVKDLFYNVPARLKFLGTDGAESRRIIDLMSRIALAYPDIRFRMINGSNTVFNTTGKGNILDNIVQIYGADIGRDLLPVDASRKDNHIRGFVSNPGLSLSSRMRQIFCVNGRVVSSPVIEKAVDRAYQERLFSGRFPVAFLFLAVPADKLDVNIHPTKKEVRFDDAAEIEDFIKDAIIDALREKEAIPQVLAPEKKMIQEPSEQIDVNSLLSTLRKDINREEMAPQNTSSNAMVREETVDYVAKDVGLPAIQPPKRPAFNMDDLTILGALFNTYILANDGDAFYMIDQHAAHERIFYERFRGQFESEQRYSQQLMIPLNFNVSTDVAATEEQWMPVIEKMGYSAEYFGNKTYLVREIPAFMELEEAEHFLNDLFNQLIDKPNVNDPAVIDKIIMRSCKAAVKAGDKLTPEEIDALISQLKECVNPFSCPHGRPTFIRMTRYEIEKLFKRV